MTDEMIIELFWSRSENAIEETDRAYGRYFHSIARGILCDSEDAKEIVNDTYLKAWNSIPPEKPRDLKAFIGRITRQLSLNRLKYNTAKKRNGMQYALVLEELEECVADSGSQSDVDSIVLRDSLNGFLRSLPIESRRVFIKRYWYMQSVSEIASALGMSESRVKSMLMRARQRLKVHLNKEGFII